jgi:hypothetical protein
VVGANLRAGATQVYVESFNYTIGANLNAQPGWAEPGGATDTVLDTIRSGSLLYPGIPFNGNSLKTGGKYSFDSYIGGNDADPGSFIGGDGNTFWFGVLLQRSTTGDGGVVDPDYGGLLLGSSVDKSNNMFVGRTGTSTQWGFEAENGSNQHLSGIDEVQGSTSLLVTRITFHDAGPEDVSLYVNPSVLTDEASLVANATGQIELFTFNDFFISTGRNATWFVDDIKIGTTYIDVVPEPAAMGLLLASGPALLARRRRAVA